jgi:hypothetical protein
VMHASTNRHFLKRPAHPREKPFGPPLSLIDSHVAGGGAL